MPGETAPSAGRAPVEFRRHHFLCALGFQGKGYSDEFTANMAGIVARLRGDGGAEIEIDVVAQADCICGPCPLRRGIGCESNSRINALDRAHGAALKIAPGDRITWGDALQAIKAHVQPGDLSRICAGCQWLEFGLCEAALQRLHDQP